MEEEDIQPCFVGPSYVEPEPWTILQQDSVMTTMGNCHISLQKLHWQEEGRCNSWIQLIFARQPSGVVQLTIGVEYKA